MTVAELIAALQKVDPTLPVIGSESIDDYLIRGIEIETFKLNNWPEPRLCVAFTEEER